MCNEYVVTGRISGWRAAKVKAKTSAEALKLARKLPADEWTVMKVLVSANLSALKSNSELKGTADIIKNIFIDKYAAGRTI
jgi:hypothetical protein